MDTNETTEVEGQEPETNQEVETEETASEETPPEGDDEGEHGDDIPTDVLRKKLKEANSEAARYRTQLREAQEALAKAKTPEEFLAATTDLSNKIGALDREVVALKYNLPEVLAKRLQGATREELEADAKELAKTVRVNPQREVSGGLNPAEEGYTQADIDAAVRSVGLRHKPL